MKTKQQQTEKNRVETHPNDHIKNAYVLNDGTKYEFHCENLCQSYYCWGYT